MTDITSENKTGQSAELFLTGFPTFDKIHGGLFPGSLIVVCGEAETGRTSFIDKIVRSQTKNVSFDRTIKKYPGHGDLLTYHYSICNDMLVMCHKDKKNIDAGGEYDGTFYLLDEDFIEMRTRSKEDGSINIVSTQISRNASVFDKKTCLTRLSLMHMAETVVLLNPAKHNRTHVEVIKSRYSTDKCSFDIGFYIGSGATEI